MLSPVVEAENLAQDPEFQTTPGGEIWARVAALLGIAQEEVDPDPAARALRILRQSVTVARPAGSWVLDVEVSAGEPEKAARLADTVAAAYLADGIEAGAESTREGAEADGQKLEAARTAAREAESRVEEHRKQHDLGARPPAEQELTKVDEDLALARTRVGDARARLEQVEALLKSRADPAALGSAQRSDVFGELRAQYAQVAQQEAELRNSLGPRHPTLSGVRAELARVRRLVSEELARLARTVSEEHESAKADAEALERSLENLRRQAAIEEQARATLRGLERDAEAARSALEAVQARVKEGEERAASNAPPARVITAAVAPQAPDLPGGLFLGLAAIGGLGLGFGQALVRGAFDRRIESAADLRAAGLVVLAALPRPPRPTRKRPGWLLAGTSPLDVARMVVTEPDTTFSTTMRRLRDALRERLEGAANARVLLAWPNAAADRDTLALSLAVAFAERGDTVLLAGQDPGQPLSETVGAAQVASFATIGLGGKLDLPHELASRISLLASGRGEPILPRSDQLARLGEAAQGTDLVLLSAFANRDGVLGADLVDWAAEVVLVAPQGSTSREAVLRGLELLPRSKPRSVVLTGAPAR